VNVETKRSRFNVNVAGNRPPAALALHPLALSGAVWDGAGVGEAARMRLMDLEPHRAAAGLEQDRRPPWLKARTRRETTLHRVRAGQGNAGWAIASPPEASVRR
jgi:hypothetical protein